MTSPASAPPPYDPYLPPLNADGERHGRRSSAPAIVTLLYGAAIMANLSARAVVAYSADPGVRVITGAAITASGTVSTALALVWIYVAWNGIPETHRGTISPRRAVLSFFIPVYNAFWVFAVNAALCDTMNGILERTGSSRRAPRLLGGIAGAAWLGSLVIASAFVSAGRTAGWAFYLLTLLAPAVTGGLWFTYMLRCDLARSVVASLRDRPNALGTPRLSQIQRESGPGVGTAIALWGLVVFGLACWQFLTPVPR